MQHKKAVFLSVALLRSEQRISAGVLKGHNSGGDEKVREKIKQEKDRSAVCWSNERLELNCDALGVQAYTNRSQSSTTSTVDLRLWLGMQHCPLDRSP